MNILVFCNVDLSQKWGDYTRVFSLMKAFSQLGNNVFIIIIRPEHKTPRITSFKENGLDVTEIHPPKSLKFKGKKGLGRYLNYLACLPAISKTASEIIQKNHIDYVYSYMPGIGSSLPAMRMKSKHKIRFILDYADLHVFVKPKRIADSSFKMADKILAITEYLRNELARKKTDSTKVYVVPNGVDLELFNPSKHDQNDIKQLKNSFGTNKLAIFSGSLQDLNIIIDSATQVVEVISGIKYIIIGDHRDPSRSKSIWEEKVKKKGLSQYFEFLGRKPHEEIPKYLLCADVCLDSFPDEPYYAAAHPIKLLEYGACEKPVVATRVSETEKIVKHGTFGLLASPGNSSEFAQHMITLLNSQELREKMGKDFANYVRTNFGWNKIAADLQKILEN
ncbi:MAG TPA: glycosyltransferase family 4 protein [Nitrosopumilaceae archaeon]|nr:glycosyltransferase family 4 protein [Nitrosopumilaceae archaeon]